MRITRIEIEKYKSIKEPIEINFYDDLPTVLIGKNGSGKTNILEALNAIAEANSNYFGSNKKHRLSTKCTFVFQKMIPLAVNQIHNSLWFQQFLLDSGSPNN